jgi:replication-associated recombination protein RarA
MSIDLSSVTNSNYGEGDMSLDGVLLIENTKLFGRYSQSSIETVIIHGASGTGKTSLVDTLRGAVNKSNGFLCSGKFFQNSQVQESYSALSSAFEATWRKDE